MKQLFIGFLLLGSFLQAQTLTIALAANVSYAMDELKTAFNKHCPDTKLRIIIGGSGKLKAQIQNGAPYDLFISANMQYPEALYKEQLAITKPKIYAYGALAILSQKKRDFTKGIAIVKDSDIRRIALANPKTAPYGKAAKEALINAKLYKTIENKLIFGESIAQTVTYTITAADLGFIAKSALYSPKMNHFTEGKNYIEVDQRFYKPIAQGIVILRHATDNSDAQKFYHFILSDEAKTIFKKYGYTL